MSLTPRSRQVILGCLALTAILTAADLGSKQWALSELSRERVGESPPVCEKNELGYVTRQRISTQPKTLIDGALELRYAENCGAAFGMLREAPKVVRKGVFFVAAIAAIGALIFMFVTGRGGKWFAWSVPFIVSGAIGNLVDRVNLGYVVDFIRVYWDPWSFEWPTFNIADSTITVGVVFLLLDGFLDRRPEEAAESAEVDEPEAEAVA